MQEITITKDQHKTIPFLWTGQETEVDITVRLVEPGASVDFRGLLIGKNNASLTMNLTVIHEAPHTSASATIKAALYDSASAYVNGMLRITPEGNDTKTWFGANLMLLSHHAKGISVPGLEIRNNDVKAGHATIVGHLDQLVLFYLMSRGMSYETAVALIVDGFINDTLCQLPKDMQQKAQKVLTS